MSEKITLRLMKKGEEEKALKVHNKVFGTNLPLSFWKWKYNCPLGIISLVAINNAGKIVGYHGNRLKKGIYYGRHYMFFDTVDVGILPKYSGNLFLEKAFNFLPSFPFLSYGFP